MQDAVVAAHETLIRAAQRREHAAAPSALNSVALALKLSTVSHRGSGIGEVPSFLMYTRE
jgi:hypothetical protein